MTEARPGPLLRLGAHLCLRWKCHFGNLLLLLVLAGVQLWQTRDVPAGLAPELPVMLRQPDGSLASTTLAEWRALHPGQAVAIHFWADWCPICRTEEHSITRLGRDLPVLTVAMQSGDAAKVGATLRQRDLPWPTVIDPHGEITRAHGLQAVPGFIVIDGQGRVRTPAVGYTTEIGMRLRLWWVSLSRVIPRPW